MSEEHKCSRCNAPYWHLTGVNTRKFECGSDAQIASMACKYALKLRARIKQLEEAGDAMMSEPCEYTFEQWTKAKEDKP